MTQEKRQPLQNDAELDQDNIIEDDLEDDLEDADLFSLEDEDGEEITLKQLQRIQWDDGETYALMCTLGDEDSENAMVFQVFTDEDGEEFLDMVDDDLAQELFYVFLSENEDYEFGDAE